MQASVYTLFSSSKGNSTYIKFGCDEFLIDCGASARAVENSLSALGTSLKNIKAIFITHEHGDHIRGLATVHKYYNIPVFAPAESIPEICRVSSMFPDEITAFVPLTPVDLCDTSVCPIVTPHDSRGSVGFRIKAGDERIGYFTDIGHLSENVLRALSGCKRVIIESNHDITMLKNGSYTPALKRRILGDYGHLSNEACSILLPHLVEHGTESFVLAHLSEENNVPSLAYKTSRDKLVQSGVSVAEEGIEHPDVRLQVAPVAGITEL